MTEATCRRKLIEEIKDMILYEEDFPTREEIHEEIIRVFNNFRNKYDFTEQQLFELANEIYDMENIQGTQGGVGVTSGKQPWVDKIKNRKTAFADAYKEYLVHGTNIPSSTISNIFNETETILDYLADPQISNTLILKKGLVMGDVQSGKTANYLALINKAVDAGYKLIILISGVHNILREQTQIRVNEGFVGKDRTGVHNYRKDLKAKSYTSVESDFDSSAVGFTELARNTDEPTILVIKKQKDVLLRLNRWLRDDEKYEYDEDNTQDYTKGNDKIYEKLSIPMLLIDDEADNASINTSDDPYRSTAINKGIRNILDIFKLRSYVGYTATPFANVFIDPDPITKDQTEDLFPDNFIYSLGTAPTYIGATKLYIPHNKEIVKVLKDVLRRGYIDSETGKLKKLKKGEEYCGGLAVGLKDRDTVTSIPESLKKAIDIWLLTIGIRKLENKSQKHNTMLVNISHITDIQTQVKTYIDVYLLAVLEFIDTDSIKEIHELDTYTTALYKTFKKEFYNEEETNYTFLDILKEITNQKNKHLIKTFIINSDTKDEEQKLKYDKYEDGINALTIGGYSLSRGFTLEGLDITYLLRESSGYDTLLQMGRWFGYRHGYEKLCRVYMDAEVIKWYTHIAQASEKLRSDIATLERNGLTPRDFCIEVLDYAGHLQVTGANRRRHALQISKAVNFSGRLNTTSIFFNQKDKLESNYTNLESFIEQLLVDTQYEKSGEHFLWKRINKTKIFEFLNQYRNPNNLTEFVDDYLKDNEIEEFDVVLINKKGDSNLTIAGIDITTTERSADVEDNTILVNDGKGGITDLSHEKIGINLQQTEKQPKTRADCALLRDRPVLFLHILQIKDKAMSENDGIDKLYPKNLSKVVACSLSFPGKIIEGRNKKVIVNKRIYAQSREYTDQED